MRPSRNHDAFTVGEVFNVKRGRTAGVHRR